MAASKNRPGHSRNDDVILAADNKNFTLWLQVFPTGNLLSMSNIPLWTGRKEVSFKGGAWLIYFGLTPIGRLCYSAAYDKDIDHSPAFDAGP